MGNSPKSVNYLHDKGDSPQNFSGGSWRQEIFNRVVTSGKTAEANEEAPKRHRTKEELRSLWKKSIHQAILLVRMEKENVLIKGL